MKKLILIVFVAAFAVTSCTPDTQNFYDKQQVEKEEITDDDI